MINTIVFQEGSNVRSLNCEIVDENDNEIIAITLHKRFRIFKKYIVKIECDLDDNENKRFKTK